MGLEWWKTETSVSLRVARTEGMNRGGLAKNRKTE